MTKEPREWWSVTDWWIDFHKKYSMDKTEAKEPKRWHALLDYLPTLGFVVGTAALGLFLSKLSIGESFKLADEWTVGHEALRNLGLMFGALLASSAAIVGLGYAKVRTETEKKQHNLDVKREQNQRYLEAIKLLATTDDTNRPARMGAIYALAALAEEGTTDDKSGPYYVQVVDTLAAYVRDRASSRNTNKVPPYPLGGTKTEVATWQTVIENLGPPPNDITTAMHMISRLNHNSRYFKNTKRRIDLRHTNLNSLELKNAQLNYVDLSNSHINIANLDNVSLYQSILIQASLYKSLMWESSIINSNFNKAILTGAYLDQSNLDGSSFYGSDLTYASLDGSRFFRASLTRANLEGASLFDADLRGARLSKTTLTDASLDGLYCNNVNLFSAIGVTQEQIDVITYDRYKQPKPPKGLTLPPPFEEDEDAP